MELNNLFVIDFRIFLAGETINEIINMKSLGPDRPKSLKLTTTEPTCMIGSNPPNPHRYRFFFVVHAQQQYQYPDISLLHYYLVYRTTASRQDLSACCRFMELLSVFAYVNNAQNKQITSSSRLSLIVFSLCQGIVCCEDPFNIALLAVSSRKRTMASTATHAK